MLKQNLKNMMASCTISFTYIHIHIYKRILTKKKKKEEKLIKATLNFAMKICFKMDLPSIFFNFRNLKINYKKEIVYTNKQNKQKKG